MAGDAIKEMEKAAFQNFDGYGGEGFDGYDDYEGENWSGSDTYDEFKGSPRRNPFSVVRPRKMRDKSAGTQSFFTINILGNNTGNASAHNLELFNYNYSFVKIENPNQYGALQAGDAWRHVDVRNSAGTGVAQLYVAGSILSNAGVGTADMVYWQPDGSLLMNFNVANSDNVLISCNEVPYRLLWEATSKGAFTIGRIRMTFTTANQISQNFTKFYKNWLGKESRDSFAVSNFKSPDQFQSLIVDVPLNLRIDAQRGLYYTLLPAQAGVNNNVQLIIAVKDYVKVEI